MSVLYAHSFPLSMGPGRYHEPLGGLTGYDLGSVGVFIFFAISGFLVTRSYQERGSLLSFLEARFLRIVPALVVLALFCILVIGPLYTSLPLPKFFLDSQTLRFLYSHITVTRIEIELPGVFYGNVYPKAINGSLWTLPYELSMYKWVAFLGVISIIRRRLVFNILYSLMCLIWFFVPPSLLMPNIHMRILSFAFFSGAFLYINRQSMPLNGFIVLGLLTVALLFHKTRYDQLITEAFLAYGAIWFAYVPRGFIRRYNSFGDYSYGLYIYAFPVQQSLAATVAGIRPASMILTASALTLLIAILSWYMIEKPALRLKGRLVPRILVLSKACLSILKRERFKKQPEPHL